MRVLILTPDFPPGRGGIQRYACRLAESLSDRAADPSLPLVRPASGDEPVGPRDTVEVLTLSADADPASSAASYIEPGRVRRPRFGGAKAAALMLNIAAVARRRNDRPDVLIAMHVAMVPAMLVFGKLWGVPTILVLHGREVSHRPWLTRVGTRAAMRTVAVSRHTRKEAIDAGADIARVEVINPGVDLRKANDVKAPPKLTRRPTVVTVARMTDAYKGHDVMIEALAELKNEFRDVRWIVIGEGRLSGELELRARERGLTHNAEFVGAVDDATRDALIAESDVFAMPSRAERGAGEGFGIVYLEAAAAGLPVVAADEGGALDAVIDGVTGLLVDPRDPERVCEALGKLLRDPELRDELGENGRRRAASFPGAALLGSTSG